MTTAAVPATTSVIPSWEFEAWLVDPDRGPALWDSRIVSGFVQVRSSKPLPIPTLANYAFLDDVDFQELRVDGPLDFSGSEFTKRLLMRNIDVAGELRLDD